jgi:crotonobetainyl-CoA:carnitine CoA-transferase CaiB-like acyl-CoA transferase
MKALFQRASTGAGSRIDISLFHSALSWMANAVMLTELGEHITRRGNTHQFFGPVSVFPTKDERFVYLATGNDRQWKALTQLDGFETLADTAYAQNAGRMADIHSLNERIAAITRQRTAAELISAMNAIGAPIAKVNTMAEVVQEPLLREGMTRSRDARSGVEVVLPPLAQTNAKSTATLSFPPRLGEHNGTVFGEVLGLSAEQIATLSEKGII